MKISAHVAALGGRERLIVGTVAGVAVVALISLIWMLAPAAPPTAGQVTSEPLTQAAEHPATEPEPGGTLVEKIPSTSASPASSASATPSPSPSASATPTTTSASTPASSLSPEGSKAPQTGPGIAYDNCPLGDFSGSRTDGQCHATAALTPDHCPDGDFSGNLFDKTCKSSLASVDGANSTSVSISSITPGKYECLLTWTKETTGVVSTQGETKSKTGGHGRIWMQRLADSGSTASCTFSLGGESLGTRTVKVM